MIVPTSTPMLDALLPKLRQGAQDDGMLWMTIPRVRDYIAEAVRVRFPGSGSAPHRLLWEVELAGIAPLNPEDIKGCRFDAGHTGSRLTILGAILARHIAVDAGPVRLDVLVRQVRHRMEHHSAPAHHQAGPVETAVRWVVRGLREEYYGSAMAAFREPRFYQNMTVPSMRTAISGQLEKLVTRQISKEHQALVDDPCNAG